MSRKILITGSEGPLGRALRAGFEAQGDHVIRVDNFRHGERPANHPLGVHYDDGGWGYDLNIQGPMDAKGDSPIPEFMLYDVLIANAKVREWEGHHRLALGAKQCIINIGSIYGVLGNDPQMYEGTEVEPTPAYYAAAKGALVNLTRWQAANLAPVRSNCVCPGGIFRNHSDEFRSRYETKTPLRRMASEGDIVPLVLFLASEGARYITGAVIPVDGGYSCI